MDTWTKTIIPQNRYFAVKTREQLQEEGYTFVERFTKPASPIEPIEVPTES